MIKKISKTTVGNKSRVSAQKVHCPELNKTFDSYKACNDFMTNYLGLKSFNVGKIIKLQNDYYKKHNLHFCVVPVSDFDLPF